MKKIIFIILTILITKNTFSQNITISSSLDWETLELKSAVTLDLASAGIKLPSGRIQGEALVNEGYLRLVHPAIMNIQVNSSETVADMVKSGVLTLRNIEVILENAKKVPPSLSQDMLKMSASYTIDLQSVSSALIRHTTAVQPPRILNPVSTASYTGIIVIATEALPAHGMRRELLPVPCLFPKIRDSEMNLIYDINMLNPEKNKMTARYFSRDKIFYNNPSGLSPEVQAVAGDRPLRLFARGVFGTTPTDLIIDRSDALLIISSEENRRLLAEGKVVFILHDSVLKQEF